jgi:hypothetical protein
MNLEFLNKTNPNCSKTYLLDTKYCLSNSLDLINANFKTLSASIMTNYKKTLEWDPIITHFISNSAKYETFYGNINQFSTVWTRVATTVRSLSAGWSKPFHLYYPTIIELRDWKTRKSRYINEITNWLRLNFPPSRFAFSQIINVEILFYDNYDRNFKFSASIKEKCSTGISPKQVCCDGCNKACCHRACNTGSVTTPERTYTFPKSCTDICVYCPKIKRRKCVSAQCRPRGAKNLSIVQNFPFSDRGLIKVDNMLSFKISGMGWVQV